MRTMGRWMVILLSAMAFVPSLTAQATPPGPFPRGGFRGFNPEALRAQRAAANRAAQAGALPAPVVATPTQAVVPPTLNQQPATPPSVSYQNGALSITAQNSTLGDILREVQKSTGATIEVPPNANERVVTRLGPAPPREVLASLLNGSSFNYVMVGSAVDPNALTTVLLSPRIGGAAAQPMQTAEAYQPPPVRTGFVPPPVTAPVVNDGADKDEEDTDEAENDAEDENGNAVTPPQPVQQAPDGQQPPNSGPKTPQQIMEMLRQNRQQQNQTNQDQQDPQEQ